MAKNKQFNFQGEKTFMASKYDGPGGYGGVDEAFDGNFQFDAGESDPEMAGMMSEAGLMKPSYQPNA